MQSVPIAKDLVLIGGGHSHAIVLKQFGMNPLPGVRLTLITNVSHTPYSGMLPGFVAGLYRFDECHIDLRPLSQFAQARMVVDQAIGLDLMNQRVLCANRPPIAFDVLSIDIGSTPTVALVPGALEHAIAVKPISQFLARWQQVIEQVRQAPDQPLTVGIVGGGAGGVELALAVDAQLRQIYRQAGQPADRLQVHLLQRGRLLPGRSAWVSRRVQQVLHDRGISVHLQETVTQVLPKSLTCASGLQIACDRIFWVTQAAAAPWLRESGLAVDDSGFVQVDDTLRSISHPQVFAAGDVAAMQNHSRPKAGVFAVRQGKPLSQNLRRALQGQPLRRFVPQQKYLILIGTGDKSAIASRDPFGWGPHPLLWRWKDRIDRRFMKQFSGLKSMTEPADQGQLLADPRSPIPPAPLGMRCAGCGAKVGSSVLEKALSRIQQAQPDERQDILLGLGARDDAAVVRVPTDRVLVQTVDYFRALIDDPFLFGQIAANHCLSDIFAMGATPHSAMAIVTLPEALAAKQAEMLYQLLVGATKVLQQAQAALIGGHTTEGAELAFGLSCNAFAPPDRLLRKSGMQPGQALILTKALGTGTLFAADMRLKAKGRWIAAAIDSMLQSNQAAAACLQHYQATACTDVTGFGLLGHLVEMVKASRVAIELDLESIAVLDGAIDTLQQGIVSSLHPQNLAAANFLQNAEAIAHHSLYPLLFDPQTSGGLLAAIPEDQAIDCLTALKDSGYSQSRLIGRVLPPQAEQATIRIKLVVSD
jgi:selenide,water dikinase